eukprot:jgi/Tetstr1/463152/TSEL_008086.t1
MAPFNLKNLEAFKKATKEQLAHVKVVTKVVTKAVTDEFEDGLFIHTVSINTKGRQPDDAIYEKFPNLRKMVPRGYSVVTNAGGDIVTIMQGPRKFEGVAAGDNDDYAEGGVADIGSLGGVQEEGKLRVFALAKENGKYATVHGYYFNATFCMIVGSKNAHQSFTKATLKAALSTEKNELSLGIYGLVLAMWDDLKNLFDSNPGYTLCGEFCDGMHFVPLEGDEKIVWFGLFKAGDSMDPLKAIRTIEAFGLPCVQCEEWESSAPLDEIILKARMGTGEGYVIYFVNTETGEVTLAKNKASVYIVKRMLREILTRKGYLCNGKLFSEALVTRLCDASDYHALSTEGAVYLYTILTRFADWMMMKPYPADAVSFKCTKDVPIKGFAGLFQALEHETGDVIAMEPRMYGKFNVDEFKDAVRPKARKDVPGVIFMQAPQGMGKTSIAALLASIPGVVCIEQDGFRGDTAACMAAVLEAMCDPNVRWIIVSRCNANPGEYAHYLQLVMCNFGYAYFAAFTLLDDPEKQLQDCMDYIRERSESSPEGLLLGHQYLPVEDVRVAVAKRIANVRPHEAAFSVKVYDENDCRLPIEEIAKSIEMFMSNTDGLAKYRVKPDKPDAVYAYIPEKGGKHVTVFHSGTKGGDPKFKGVLEHGSVLDVTLTHHVEELAPDGVPTGFAAYRASLSDGVTVQTGKPHVTDKVPEGGKPVHSISYVMRDQDDPSVKVTEISPPEVYKAFVFHMPPFAPLHRGKGKAKANAKANAK